MKKLRLRRPSAPMIIAIIALVAAIGGTAVAGGGFVPKTKFRNFKQNINTKVNAKLGGPINYVTTTQPVSSATATPTTITAACPTGTHPTGGGVKTEDPALDTVIDQYPTAQSYVAHVLAGTSGPVVSHSFRVIAACVTVSSTSGSPPSS